MPQGSSLDVSLPSGRIAEWLLLLVRLPGEAAKPAGVLLLDVPTDRLYVALADEISGNEETTEVWAALKEDLEERASEIGGAALLNTLEDHLSQFLQIRGPRQQISTTDPAEAVANLFREYILSRGQLAQGN
jgi:3-oxoacyl-(acyl-carrier-protein) synthase